MNLTQSLIFYRKPKLFYVTSSSTTSTIRVFQKVRPHSTLENCFIFSWKLSTHFDVFTFRTNHYSTSTICYVTANTGVLNAACPSRKKRSFNIEDLEDPDINASAPLSTDPLLDSSQDMDRDSEIERQARSKILPRNDLEIFKLLIVSGSRFIGGPLP